MYLKSIELLGFKSFGKKERLVFTSSIASIVGPNGSGKCVTGDTLLQKYARREKERNVYELVAIKDIQPGDIVRTLHERKGMFADSRVRALLEQGVRPVYRVTTSLGKTIRATDNHPFLRAPSLPEGRIAIFIDGANVESSLQRMGARFDYMKLLACFGKERVAYAGYYQADFSHKGQGGFFTKLKKIGYHLITKPVKVIERRGHDDMHKANFDVEIAVDACLLKDRYDVAVLFSGDSDFTYLAEALIKEGKQVVVIAPYRATARELRAVASMYLNVASMPFVSFAENGNWKGPRRGHHDQGDTLAPSILTQIHPFVKGGAWTDVDKLRVGDMVAVFGANGRPVYERIVEIAEQLPEAVYDIEIEETHNFLADDFVAHNSNVAEAFRFVLGEQSMKSLRSKKGEDLIWGGSPALARANRASVKVVFDNSNRLLDIDFPEVTIERVVHRDGQNEYLLNGTQVRLKDVIRLLAGANIGGSGYQIISQGEADRILNASPKERREMVEDALGLKLYQHKKAESERKLEETAANIEKTRSLRREIGPHLNFLRMQVEKIEKARELREELGAQMNEYLAREHAWITQEDARLLDLARAYDTQIRATGRSLEEARARRTGGGDAAIIEIQSKLRGAEHALADARRGGERVSRELGRAEGALEAVTVTVTDSISAGSARQFARDMEDALDEAEDTENISEARLIFGRMRDRIGSFIEGFADKTHAPDPGRERHVAELGAQLAEIRNTETAAASELESLRQELSRARESGFVAERDIIGLEAQLREAQGKLSQAQSARAAVAQARERFEEEVREGIALIGADIHGWERNEIPQGALSEDRSVQEKRRRAMERLKIKIEEAGIGNGDAVVREFNQTKTRDEFLSKELADLESSAASLRDIISELEKTIDQRFTEGLGHINAALADFFAKLFGGGSASLTVETPRLARRSLGEGGSDDGEDMIPEEESLYAGLAISVSLPRKKVRGLEVLSGGERALTSIALIFSMSQVNPPPFLILDETDAALDEANSKRYADMIRLLGAHSQLIVITHNRATMAAAGELYGVTMSGDGVSKLLSVKLAEAEKTAK